MTLERDGRFLQPLVGLPEEYSQERINHTEIGAIIYANNSQCVLLEESGTDQLQGFYHSLPEGFNPKEITDGRERIVTLNSLMHVRVGQMQRANLSVRTFESISTQPSVSVNVLYTDIVDQKGKKAVLDEDIILRFLTGQAGGIAVFRGFGLPEENALVFESGTVENYSGFILFVHPNDNYDGINSVAGVREFFEELNKEFTENCNTPLLKKTLADLERHIKEGKIVFNSKARAEIFRAQVIANVRLFEKTGEEKYRQFLNTHLPSAGIKGIFERGENRNLTQLANKTVERLIIKDQDHGSTTGEKPQQKAEGERGIYQKLETKYMKRLRQEVESCFGEECKQMISYLDALAKYVCNDGANEALLHDVETLLDEFRDWPHKNITWNINVNLEFSLPPNRLRVFKNDNYAYELELFVRQVKNIIKIQKDRHFIS